MTQKARKISRSRSGNGAPASVSSGMASAAARHTAPRMPLHATSAVELNGAGGVAPARLRTTRRGR